MRIFLAGGSGVIGRRLIPQLAEAGHVIAATTRRPENVDDLTERGARPVVVDVYDAPRLAAAVPTPHGFPRTPPGGRPGVPDLANRLPSDLRSSP